MMEMESITDDSETESSPPPQPEPLLPPLNLIIQNMEVRTVVFSDESHDIYSSLHEAFTNLLSSISGDGVIALDIQNIYSHHWSHYGTPVTGKVAVLTLCTGRFCLLIHLLRISYTPVLLAYFLDRPDLSFAGVGIHCSLVALQRDYGLICRNVVDLGQLAATVKEKPYLKVLGLAGLANEAGLGDVTFKAPGPAFIFDWSAPVLNAEQVELAANHAFLTFRVATHLLGGGDVI